MSSQNPFVRYRHLLDSYRRAIDSGWSDERFVEMVDRFDARVAAVDGHGFSVTPFARREKLESALGAEHEIWVKDDTGNVGGSHKARHLFGLMLHHAVSPPAEEQPWAIASCGNAALAAGVVAHAVGHRLQVFVPTWADEIVLGRLTDLGAEINVAERRAGEEGDPAYLRFREAVAAGAQPFTVQGTDAPATLDGGRTIGWEMAERLGDEQAGLDRVYAQVGGGALASSCIAGLADGVAEGWLAAVPELYPVQAEGCAPLARAWDELRATTAGLDGPAVLREAASGDYMRPWDDPHSAATGILDDVTYDWLTIVEPMLRWGGEPVVATEAEISEAHDMGIASTGISVSHTGTAGLAGLLHHHRTGGAPPAGARVAVLFTGAIRGAD